MTEHGLYPSFIKVEYHSTFAPHVMLLPTRQWNPLGGTTGHGGYVAWDDSDRDADGMIIDLITELTKICSDEVDFDNYIIYNVPTPGASPIPVAGDDCNALTGIDGTPGWFKATQFTYTFFDTAFNTVKLVLLDASSNGDFSRRSPGSLTSDESSPSAEFMLDTNAWSSRAGFRPSVLRSLAVTINDKLRREYGMS